MPMDNTTMAHAPAKMSGGMFSAAIASVNDEKMGTAPRTVISSQCWRLKDGHGDMLQLHQPGADAKTGDEVRRFQRQHGQNSGQREAGQPLRREPA